MNKLKTLLVTINNNLLFILSTFLLAFIPLFPKIPLFDILPGYIVRVRIEDFIILLTSLVWLRDAYQKKFSWNTSYLWLIVAYIVIGATSIILATSLLLSIPSELLHIGKSSLHLFRYIEYFSLFFFLYSSIQTKKQIKVILTTIVITLILVISYGFGQEYLHFPLYSTMNREYSKGQKLYLQANARPQSTFAGHYDLGAYLVITLPLIFALAIKKRKKYWWKTKEALLVASLHLVHLFGAGMLISSGSKTALFAYLVGILIVIFFRIKEVATIKQQLKWGVATLLSLAIILIITLMLFAKQTETMIISIAEQSSLIEKIASKIPVIKDKLEAGNKDNSRPQDLYGEGHEFRIETKTDENGVETKIVVAQKSTWSENALKYGISMGIRLDTLWPQAIKGFLNNPLFGNGYATLNKQENEQFTEADSTDNNYLRTLGETGVLGFISFYGLVIYILTITLKNTKASNNLIKTLNIGLTASIIGLLINATYIDVFASSKVAFSFWGLMGVAVKSNQLKQSSKKYLEIPAIFIHLKKHLAFYLSLLLLFFLLHQNPYASHTPIANFDTSNEAIENVTIARCYLSNKTFSVCRNTGLVLKKNFNLYSLLLIPFLQINSNPTTYYFLNILIAIIVLTIVYLVIYKTTSNNHSQVKTFSLLFLLLSFFFFYHTTQGPLTTKQLFNIAVTSPLLILILVKIGERLHNQRIFSIILLTFALIFILPQQPLTNIKRNFRNQEKNYKHWVVKRANVLFKDKLATNTVNNKQYLITLVNPYFFDFYKTNNYYLLPLSTHQEYFKVNNLVWHEAQNDMISKYQELLNNKQTLYITDFGINTNTDYFNSFQEIKKNFNLNLEVLDCEESCNFYQVTPNIPKISAPAKTINSKLNLTKLNQPYSFNILTTRFNPHYNPINPNNNSKDISLALLSAKINPLDTFTIFVSDYINTDEQRPITYFFNNQLGIYSHHPVIYANTNSHSFFTKQNYFIFMNIDKDSQISIKEKKWFYNILLDIEKMPEVNNIFIVIPNLDWQNKSKENNFLTTLETKLLNFPKVTKYIITNNHNQALNRKLIEYQYNDNLDIHYYANTSNIIGYGANYLHFTVDKLNKVTINEKKITKVW